MPAKTYLVGTPENGPFADFTAADDKAARAWVRQHYGKVLDVVDWTDDHGNPTDLFIVRP